MPGNKRIYYACLGVAYCGGSPIQGARSVSVSLSRNISNIFSFGNSNAIATYGNMPDIEISFSSYLTNLGAVNNLPGFSSFCGLDIVAGPDNQADGCLVANQCNRFTQLLLSKVSYNMPSTGPFTMEATYKGYSKSICTSSASIGPPCQDSGTVCRRINFNENGSSLPSAIVGNPIDNVSITYSINRQSINEFATRKPYASYVTYPIETSCTFDLNVTEFDSHSLSALDTACKNSSAEKSSITIALCGNCGGSLTLTNAYLTGLSYSGAEAGSQDNLKLSATYTGYSTPEGINPVTVFPSEETDPCACS